MTRPCLLPLFLLLATHVSAMEPSAAAPSTPNEAAPQQKKYLHPHAVHLNVMAHDFPEFTVEEIMDWPGLIKRLQARPPMLPFDAASEMMLTSLSPGDLNNEDKRVMVTVLNRAMDALAATADGEGGKAGERRWNARKNITDKVRLCEERTTI
ncbi:MAG: hypothetical protein COX20_12515 [Desulfobacterales bacterium CG23_combo_of_CG06-09_8_20_14_all_52_9]|nr:MAG: hypothetical protein COX20_12515 [Desulfobacterales bacterium CG23_combo_of_CG06-09_8_20_14_all_52_9]